MATVEAATARGRETRQRLLNATAELVAQRGFHAVGIADIGAAAGVSGAAIYRHFATKHDLLVALIEQVVGELLDGARAVTQRCATDPTTALEALVRAHVDFALRDRAIIAVYDQEIHNLPVDERRRVRRQQRAYAELWGTVVGACRPDLTVQAASAAVHALFGLINSVADFHSRLTRDEHATLLTALALAAINPR